MIGDYALHYPLTDFAVGLLVIAAVLELARIVLKRERWTVTVDLLLFLGFGGAVASVGSGLWLLSAHGGDHSGLMSTHHLFAYSTVGVAAATCAARLFERRVPLLGAVKTIGLLASAALVSSAGFYGGRMAHPPGEAHGHAAEHGAVLDHHDAPMSDVSTAAPDTAADAVDHHGSAIAPSPVMPDAGVASPPGPAAPSRPAGHEHGAGPKPHAH